MQLHQLKFNKKKARKRVGRGGKKGTYSGRGLKGQKSRAGKKPRLGFAGGDASMLQRFPKQRGTVGKTRLRKGVKLSRYRIKQVILNLKDIDKHFKLGEIVCPKVLLEKKLIQKINNKIPVVKVLAKGKLTKKLVFKNIKLSKKAYELVSKSHSNF